MIKPLGKIRMRHFIVNGKDGKSGFSGNQPISKKLAKMLSDLGYYEVDPLEYRLSAIEYLCEKEDRRA